MAGGSRNRIRALLGGAVVAAAALLSTLAPTSAQALPAPNVPVAPAPEGGASLVFGANAAGDVFYNTAITYSGSLQGGDGRVRHADGSLTVLAQPLKGRGTIGPDGRLWLPTNGSLWATAPDGTRTEYPVVTPEATATTGISQVEAGSDGRIWFLDPSRSSVGSVAADGGDLKVWPVAGTGALSRLAPGADGRMWVTRAGGVLQAVDGSGQVSTYPTLGPGVTALRASGGSLYAVVSGALIHIAANGGWYTAAALPDVAWSAVGTSDGWAWFQFEDLITAVSPSGRISRFSLARPYLLPGSWPDVSLAPDQRGGFVVGQAQQLGRIASGSLSETFTATGTVVSVRGMYVLRVTATGRTPGGSPLTGPVEVVVWGTQLLGDDINTYQEERATVVASATLASGRATVDIPITSELVAKARPGALLHARCCDVSVRRPGPAGSPGLASWRSVVPGGPSGSYYGSFVPSTTAAWLSEMSTRAIGRPMGTADQVRLAADLAAGRASRGSVSRWMVGTTSWKYHRVDTAFQRWFGRLPTSSERTYWAGKLISGTTSSLDLALGTKTAARDATGTTNAKRAAHLAAALHLSSSYATGYRTKLDAGTPWATVVRDAYNSSTARQQRIADLGPRSSFTPSVSALAAKMANGDEREALIAVLATMPITETLGY